MKALPMEQSRTGRSARVDQLAVYEDKPDSLTPKHWDKPGTNFLWGAFWGMLAWQVYALIEYAASTLTPLLLYKNMMIAAWHWKLSLLLFGMYTVAGIVLGGVAGVAYGAWKKVPLDNTGQGRAIGTLTLVLAFIANLMLGRPDPFTLMVSAVVAGTLIWSLSSKLWSGAFTLAANPWWTVLLLLVVAKTNYELLETRSSFLRGAVSIAIVSAFAGLSILRNRIWGSKRAGASLGHPAAVLCGVGLALGCAVFFNRDLRADSRGPAPVGNASQPNIVLITLDTTRADHLSLYGYNRNTTPNLAQLAASASVFVHAMAAGDLTLTSHGAIFTGTYASWNGAHAYLGHVPGQPISESYATLPEILSKHGYSTAAVVANTSYLQSAFGFNRGFQFWDSRVPIQMNRSEKPLFQQYYLRRGARQILGLFACTDAFDLTFRRAQEINRVAFDFVNRNRTSGKPFFLFLNYMDAHAPYLPPAPFDAAYSGKDCSIPANRMLQLIRSLAARKTDMPEHVRQHYISQYDGGITYMDTQIGELIQQMKRLGLYENTLLIITGDHGEAFGERHLLGHGLSAYQDEVHVPLIVKYPGASHREVIGDAVGHTDILPTIMEVAGIAPPTYIQGRSLRDQSGNASRKLVTESFPEPSLNLPGYDRVERAFYSETFKYVSSTSGKHELYDFSADPDETHDLCSAQPTRCDQMQHGLAQWEATIPKQARPKRKLDPQTLERLKSLGYAQ
jgi:arylsulfatase A-like enzyme